MVFSCGLSSYNIAFFHLLNHGCFKALLFLGAGSLIHSFSDKQDIRYQGGVFSRTPLSYIFFLIGSLSLSGFPFLTGFYSKDIILEISLINFHLSGLYVYFLGVLTAGLTASYSAKLLFLVFLNPIAFSKNSFKKIKENGVLISISLLTLGFFSIGNGFFLSDLFLGFGSDYFSNLIHVSPNHYNHISSEFLPATKKSLPFFISFLAVIATLSFLSLDKLFLYKKKEIPFFYRTYFFVYSR
jgi:NADH-ubiquinone oxidoreductase chain 5